MDTDTYVEQVDKIILHYIISNRHKFKITKMYVAGNNVTDEDQIYSLLSNYLNCLDDEGRMKNTYVQKNGRGRKWPQQIGLTSLSRKIRHSIAPKYNIDIDIKNCHPVLLSSLCQKYEIQHPYLQYYLDNRETVLKEFEGDRDFVKEEILKMINGGIPKLKSTEWLHSFNRELKHIRNVIANDNRDILKLVESKGSNYNYAGKVLNVLLCDMENKALELMINYIKSLGLEITSLAYDGLMIKNTIENRNRLNEILKGCEALLKQEFKVPVRVVEKVMNEGFNIDIEEIDTSKLIPIGERKSLLRPQTIITSNCSCTTPHSDMIKLINFMISNFKIQSINEDFNRGLSFLKNYTKGKCLNNFVVKLAKEIEDFDYSMISNLIENSSDSQTWSWLLTCVPKTAKYLDIRKIIQDNLPSDEESKTQFKEVEACNFDSKDDIFIFIQTLRKTVFNSEDELITFFLEGIDKVCKVILFPYCFVINKGEDGFETIATGKLSLMSRYRYVNNKGANCVSQQNCTQYLTDVLWISEKLPQYKHITFRPNERDVKFGELNTYPGFKARRVDKVDLKLIDPVLHHIRTCWADENEEVYNYILQWFHRAFSKPWEKTGVVLLLVGTEGTGKGTLLDNLIIPYIYGKDISVTVQGLGPITQQFNSICMNKLLIVANEVSSEGHFHTCFDKLKALITDPTLSIEKKGIDIFKSYPNYMNFIFTTNNTDGVRLGKTDRRYCCIETSSRYTGNWDYFDNLYAHCTEEVANHFYTYLLDLKCEGNIKNIPRTALKEDMLINCTSSVQKFVNDIKSDEFQQKQMANEMTPKNQKWDDVLFVAFGSRDSKGNLDRWIPSRKLYEGYRVWCYECQEKVKSSTMFGKEIKTLLESKKSMGIMKYKI